MRARDILNGDWTDYNERKKAANQDPMIFSCTEGWEINFLVNKIRLAYPIYPESEIRQAVVSCCNIIITGRREDLVSCIARGLE